MVASYKTIICVTLTEMLGDTSPKQFAAYGFSWPPSEYGQEKSTVLIVKALYAANAEEQLKAS